MKNFLRNRSFVQRSLLLTTTIAIGIWVSGCLFKQPSIQVMTSKATPSQPAPPSNVPASQPQVYWLRSNQNKLALVAKALPPNTYDASSQQQILTTAMQQLLAAQPSDNLGSAIPKGTKLRSLQTRSDGVHLDLSREFQVGGGSTSIIYRVAQVIYTASSLNPDEKVFLSVEGQPIDRDHPLGGEGLILRQPTTRSQFAEDFSLTP